MGVAVVPGDRADREDRRPDVTHVDDGAVHDRGSAGPPCSSQMRVRQLGRHIAPGLRRAARA